MARAGSACSDQLGTSLIEVVVAMTLFSVVLLGLMAWHWRAVTMNLSAYYHSVAAVRAEAMLERLRANHAPDARQREFVAWNTMNQSMLPDGHGSYQCDLSSGDCTITLAWYAKKRQVFAMTGAVDAPKL